MVGKKGGREERVEGERMMEERKWRKVVEKGDRKDGWGEGERATPLYL